MSKSQKMSRPAGEKEVYFLMFWAIACAVMLLVICGVVLDPDQTAARGQYLSFGPLFGIICGVLVQSMVCGILFGFRKNYRTVISAFKNYRKHGIQIDAVKTVHLTGPPHLVRMKYKWTEDTIEGGVTYQITKKSLLELEPKWVLRQEKVSVLVIPGYPKSGRYEDEIHSGYRNYSKASRLLTYLLWVVCLSYIAFIAWLMIILPEIERQRYFIVPMICAGFFIGIFGFWMTTREFRNFQQYMWNPTYGVTVRRCRQRASLDGVEEGEVSSAFSDTTSNAGSAYQELLRTPIPVSERYMS